jgi:hypothetical protein
VPNDRYESTHHFLEKMDSGELDRSLLSELKKLTREQLEELASILMERSDKRSHEASLHNSNSRRMANLGLQY